MRRAPLIALCFVFLSAAVPAQDRSANRLLRVQAARLVRVCIWPDYYSVTYRNPKTQTLSGIDIEMAQALGKDLGVGVEFVICSGVDCHGPCCWGCCCWSRPRWALPLTPCGGCVPTPWPTA